MAIRSRGTGFQWDRRIDGSRYREQFDTMAEAQRWDHLVAASILSGDGYPERPKKAAPEGRKGDLETLSGLAQATWSKFWRESDHATHYQHNVDRMVRDIGDLKVSDIDDETVEEYVTLMEDRGLANGTINRRLACLSKVLRYGERKGVLEKLPTIDRKRELGGRIRWLTDDEEKSILGTFKTWGLLDHVDTVVVLIDTGLRPSELWRIEARDANFKTGTLTAWKTKNGKPRSVVMTSRVKAIFKRRCEGGAKPFPFGNVWLRHPWDRMREHLGFSEDPHFVPYICRHTCASRLAQAGVSLQVIMEWLGHSSMAMTLRYAHLSPKSLDVAAQALEKAAA